MAEQLNMGGLSLGEQQQAAGPRSYIPPHMRGKMGGGNPQMAPGGPGAPAPGGPGPTINGLNNSAWAE